MLWQGDDATSCWIVNGNFFKAFSLLIIYKDPSFGSGKNIGLQNKKDEYILMQGSHFSVGFYVEVRSVITPLFWLTIWFDSVQIGPFTHNFLVTFPKIWCIYRNITWRFSINLLIETFSKQKQHCIGIFWFSKEMAVCLNIGRISMLSRA